MLQDLKVAEEEADVLELKRSPSPSKQSLEEQLRLQEEQATQLRMLQGLSQEALARLKELSMERDMIAKVLCSWGTCAW